MLELNGNIGEWSEIYTLLKLLSTGRIYAADSDLNKMDEIFFEVIKVLRKERNGIINLMFNKDNNTISIIRETDGSLLNTLATNQFEIEAKYLLEQLQSIKANAFSIPRTISFMEQIHCMRLKAPADDKSDITIKIHDINTGYEKDQGFSIKSRLGKASTLLNPGKTTNFTYLINGDISDTLMNEFNCYDGTIRESLNFLMNKGCSFQFIGMDNDIFKNNLLLIDSDLPKIAAYMLLEYYVNGFNEILQGLTQLKKKNPLQYDNTNHPFYEYKFKKLLTESAVGMLPNTIWTGKADTTGGYIIVREDGEVLCYHLYNRNQFEDYLLKNTKFDTPSRTRYNFAKVYKENNLFCIKLNMQIRFIK